MMVLNFSSNNNSWLNRISLEIIKAVVDLKLLVPSVKHQRCLLPRLQLADKRNKDFKVILEILNGILVKIKAQQLLVILQDKRVLSSQLSNNSASFKAKHNKIPTLRP